MNLEAFHGSSSEVFWVSYSADGGVNFKTMMTIRGNVDENSVQTFTLPRNARGNIWVKVTDSNSTDSNADSLFVDRLVIETEGAATLPPELNANVAVAETTVRGAIVDNSFMATFNSDNRYEILQETGTTSQLEHQWKFELQSSDVATVELEAFHNSNEEVFWVSYSTDPDRHWQTMLTVTNRGDTNESQTYELPAGISGDLWIKVRDSRGSGDSVASRLFVDRLTIVKE